jgi:Kae1-associated kinase Bud32
MVKARKCGVNVPYIMHVDVEHKYLIMQYIDGVKLKDFLEKDTSVLGEVGRCIALLHNDSIIHGDLTTSNVMVTQRDDTNVLVL